jgi:hypothetical protein
MDHREIAGRCVFAFDPRHGQTVAIAARLFQKEIRGVDLGAGAGKASRN